MRDLVAGGGRAIEGKLMEMSSHPDDATVFQPDPVIEAYKKDIDRTLLRENLKLTPAQRVEKLQRFMRDLMAIRGVARHSS